MNLLLPGIGESDGGASVPLANDDNDRNQDGCATLPVVTKDALAGKHGEYETVLANAVRQEEQRNHRQRCR